MDAEQRMARPVAKGLARPLRPAHRQPHRAATSVIGRGQRGAFVKAHHDVRPQQALDLHAALGRQHVARPVDMARNRTPFLGQLAQEARLIT
jgi:hypothetical protein